MNFDPAGHSEVEVIAELHSCISRSVCVCSCVYAVCVCLCVCAVLFVCESGSGLRQLESGLCFLSLRAGFGVCVRACVCVCVFVLTIWLEL